DGPVRVREGSAEQFHGTLMRFPLSMTAGMAKYIFKNKLMPRPEWQKQVAPKAGAANPFRILPSGFSDVATAPRPHPMMNKRFPIVLMLEPEKNIYLCTNGMFIRKRLHEFRPDRRFFFNVHLDGLEKNHDIAVEREGVFQEAIEGIKVAKQAGYMVCTNTTVYKETDMNE